MAVETVTTVTVNNNCQTYLPRNRFSRCSAFCFKRLFCALYLPSADAPHAPPPPPRPPLLLHTPPAPPKTGILSRYLRKGAPGHGVRGIGWGGRGAGRGREKGDRERRGGGDYLGPSSAVQPPTLLLLLLLLLPIVEPRGPGEAAPCLAAMQPLYHSNLLIVGAQLAHGGFLLESPNIN